MAEGTPSNPDLPSSWRIPGIYIVINLSGAGAGLNNFAKRLLLVGHKLPVGIKPPNVAFQVTGQSDANLYCGRGSDLARIVAAVISQVGGGALDLYCLPVPEPVAGTAATHLISLIGTAKTQDALNFWICGYAGSIGIVAGDTPAVIAQNLAAAINAMKDIPVTATANGATVTLVYAHAGLVGNDLPVIVEIPGDSGVKASPGSITFANNAVGAGAAVVAVGATTVAVALADGATPAAVATAMAAELNGGGYPVTADASGGVLTLYYAPERVVHRLLAQILTSTGMTATAAIGTAGSGAPQLTTALANLAGQAAFRCWATAFNDVGSLGAMSAFIELHANGLYQKGQSLWAASTDALPVAGGIPVGTTPTLTSSIRYHVGWCPDSPQQAYELGARHAARVCVEDYYPQNYDGEPLVSESPSVPLLLPHPSSRPSPDDVNAAMNSYYLTPYVVDEAAGELVILRGVTTSDADDDRLRDTALQQTTDFIRFDMGGFLGDRFKQKSIKVSGPSNTPKTITTATVGDAIIERMFTYETADFFDGADELKKQVKVGVNVQSPSRLDALIPYRVPVPLHQIDPTLAYN